MRSIDEIIVEEIRKVTLLEESEREFLEEKKHLVKGDLEDLIRNALKRIRDHKKQSNGEEISPKKYNDDEKRKKRGKKPRFRKRKLKNGRSVYYNYDDWENANKKISKADMDSIIDTVDQEKTNIAAIARIIFPNHTDEGAQSQLRKILNHERPLTKGASMKLYKLISSGKVALK